MAFPTGWGRKCALTVPAAQISGTSHTDFPVLLTLANLPSEMFDSDGIYPALNGGGDIRFSSDSAGTTQLACEIVSFVTDANPASGSAEIWVKIPTLATNAGSGTTFYIWYNKSGETQPAVTDTYGRNAVWADYEQVVHGQDVSGSIVDSTGNYTGTVSGSVANAAGVFGWGQSFEFDGTAGEIGFGTLDLPAENRECAIQALIRPASDPSGNQMIYGGMGGASTYAGVFLLVDNSDYSSGNTDCLVFSFQSGASARKATTSESVKASDTLAAVASFNNGVSADEYNAYLNDSLEYNVTSGLSGYVDDGARTWEIGGSSGYASDYFDGRIQECRLKYAQIPQEWVLTEYNAANDPAAFVSDGAPESVGGSPGAIGDLAAVETGSDSATIAGSVSPINVGDLAASETGSDAAAITGGATPGVSGDIDATETGADSAAMAGSVAPINVGDLAAIETGSDAAAISGSAPAPIIGDLAALEVGSDVASIVGGELGEIAGDLVAVETGSDLASMAGGVAAINVGDVAATEAGADTAAISGGALAAILGDLAAFEVGADGAAISSEDPGIFGALAVVEVGGDSARVLGLVAPVLDNDAWRVDSIDAVYGAFARAGVYAGSNGAAIVQLIRSGGGQVMPGGALVPARGSVTALRVRVSDLARPARGAAIDFDGVRYTIDDYSALGLYEWVIDARA